MDTKRPVQSTGGYLACESLHALWLTASHYAEIQAAFVFSEGERSRRLGSDISAFT